MSETRCKRCIMPASLPNTRLDESGVCRHCRRYETRFGNWDAVKEQKKRDFEELLERVKKLKRPYDCLVPLSGGKDSTYSLYVCGKVHGMRCLSVTFNNGFLSEHARSNIGRALAATGADHLMYSVDRGELMRLYRLFLEKSGDFCSACMRGIEVATVAARVAFDIPLVISGAGGKVSYINALPEVFQEGDERFARNVLEGEPLKQYAFAAPAAAPSLRTSAAKLLRFARRGLDRAIRIAEGAPVSYVAHIFSYLDVSPDQVLHTLEQEVGWVKPPGEVEHMDCRAHGVQSYIWARKFPQLTPNTFHRCGLIRRGVITREEALRAEEKELAHARAPAALGPFLEDLGMSEAEFDSAVSDGKKIDKFR
jgi:hypothetical protein